MSNITSPGERAPAPAIIPVADRMPLVTEKKGRVIANSRDVAEYFEKEHRNVLRDIDNLLKDTGEGVLNFEQTPYVDPQNGQTYRTYDMDRDAFSILAMGFTGAKALAWKLKYVQAFNAMEKTLREGETDIRKVLNDPKALRMALADYSERVEQLQEQVAELEPKAEALDRIARTDGLLTMTATAKTLNIPPKKFVLELQSRRWVYRHPGGRHLLGYQDKINAGLLDHKSYSYTKEDGEVGTSIQCLVTPKGLARLALDLQSPHG